MARSFDQLAPDMNSLSKQSVGRATTIIRAISKGFSATATDATPVDTGLARSNWRGSLNVPAPGTIPPYAPGIKLGIGEGANALAAKAQQKEVFNRFDAKRNRVAYLTNRVPYITFINDGKPSRAPHNMIEAGNQKVQRILAKELRKPVGKV